MEIQTKLASLTDREALLCLNRILSGIQESGSSLPLAATSDLVLILQATAQITDAGPLTPKLDSNIIDFPKAVRVILIEFLESPELKPRLLGALDNDRSTLVEPITSAMIIAGIIVILTIRFELHFKRHKDKTFEFEVSIKKTPTSEKIISSLISLVK